MWDSVSLVVMHIFADAHFPPSFENLGWNYQRNFKQLGTHILWIFIGYVPK